MNKPHKHAALIKAWADNPQLEFQFRGAGCQSNCWYNMSPSNPDWSVSEVRIKPKTIKYRTYLWQDKSGYGGVYTCTYEEDQAKDFEYSPTFIKWLGDWVKVEV